MASSRQRPLPDLPLGRRDALRLLLAAAPPAAALLAADSPTSLAALRARSPAAAGERPPGENPAGGQPAADEASPAAASTTPATMAGWGSSTMAGMAAALESLASDHGWAYVDGGAGGQTAEQILARLGSRPARMDAGRVPAHGPVVLTTGSMSARSPAAFDAWAPWPGSPGTSPRTAAAKPDTPSCAPCPATRGRSRTGRSSSRPRRCRSASASTT